MRYKFITLPPFILLFALNSTLTIAEEPKAEFSYPSFPAQIMEEVESSSEQMVEQKPTRKVSLISNRKTKNNEKEKDRLVTMRSTSKTFVINVEPGINQVIPIAIGHINRIVTPFDSPAVNTISDATIEANQNVLYVATDSEHPITMFVKPDVNDESQALSLTLNPMKIPPIEATLKLAQSSGFSTVHFNRSKKAEKWEKERPYSTVIVDAMRKLALNELPDGYSIGPANKGSFKPTCLQSNISYDFINGQFMTGHNLDVSIGLAINISKTATIEINESECIDGNIVAVSSWPKTILQPGERTEIYVMIRNDLGVSQPSTQRRSLLEN